MLTALLTGHPAGGHPARRLTRDARQTLQTLQAEVDQGQARA